MRYKIPSTGEVLEADGLRHLAEVMWQTKFNPEPTLEEWMLASARRMKMWDGTEVSVESPEAHVRGLVDIGFVVPVTE